MRIEIELDDKIYSSLKASMAEPFGISVEAAVGALLTQTVISFAVHGEEFLKLFESQVMQEEVEKMIKRAQRMGEEEDDPA